MYYPNKQILISLFFFSFLPITVFAQDKEITRQQLQDMTKVSGSLMTKSATETIGSPYLSDDFLQGHIMMNKNARTESTGIRYNMEKNEVEFLRDKEIFIVDANKIDGFKLYGEDHDIVFKNGYQTDIDKIDNNTLLRVVYEGDVKLLVNYSAKLHEDISTYATATKKNKYTVSRNHFIVTRDGAFHKVKSPEKDILRTFSDYQNQIKEYINKNNLDFNNEMQIVQVIKYYENLTGKGNS